VTDEKEIVIDLLRDFLGKEKAHYDLKCQITFDCPVCSYDLKGLDHGDGKGNLEINYCRHVYNPNEHTNSSNPKMKRRKRRKPMLNFQRVTFSSKIQTRDSFHTKKP